jgi:hypothetical protein
MSKVIEILLGLVGTTLESLIVELYRYDGDSNVTINDIQLSFGNTKFILGCSGDGSVLIKKGEVVLLDYDEYITSKKLHVLEDFSGCKVRDIDVDGASIVISLGDSRLEIVNDDDELVLVSNGKKLLFDEVI